MKLVRILQERQFDQRLVASATWHLLHATSELFSNWKASDRTFLDKKCTENSTVCQVSGDLQLKS